MEPRLRASPGQFAALVKFMEREGDLSKPQMGGQGRLQSDRLWLNLAKILNSCEGGVEKSVDKWKKVWADWKAKTKKKFIIQKRRSGVIGGPRMRLTALEQRVVAILGANGAVNQAETLQDFNPQSDEDEPLAQEELNEVHLIIQGHNDDRFEFKYPDPSSQSATPLQQNIEAQYLLQRSPLRAQTPQDAEKEPTIPQSTSTIPRRVQLRARRDLEETALNITAQDFVALEQRRLQLEETREKHEHEREIERLRLESRRIEMAREHNQLLQQLSGITNKLIDTLHHLERA